MFAVYFFAETEMATYLYDMFVSYDRYTTACPELKLCKQFVLPYYAENINVIIISKLSVLGPDNDN